MTTTLPSIESTSAEPLEVEITTRSDPTGTAPEFVATAVTAEDPSGTWQAGVWVSTWSTKTGRVVAHSATVGVAGDITVAQGSDYKLWMKYGDIIKSCGIFRVD